MNKDKILEIKVDDLGRLHIKPEKSKFTMIYRTATEVHWDEKKMTLYSPKPNEWSYVDWYVHIIKVVENECSIKLELTDSTDWINIPINLKSEIIKVNLT